MSRVVRRPTAWGALVLAALVAVGALLLGATAPAQAAPATTAAQLADRWGTERVHAYAFDVRWQLLGPRRRNRKQQFKVFAPV